jgi:hypothetical protein
MAKDVLGMQQSRKGLLRAIRGRLVVSLDLLDEELRSD